MWSKLDDALIDHPKIIEAGAQLGKNGQGLAFALYVLGILWANRYLSDGFIPTSVVKQFRHVDKPLAVAAALSEARLWEEVANGYQIHDFHDFNFTAEQITARRKSDRDRKRSNGRVGGRTPPGIHK